MPRGPSAHLTLSLGGVAIVLATLVPIVAETVGLFPVPYDLSWLNQFGQPLFAQLSAVVLVAAFTILAMGVEKEPGIAGASIIGKLSLILFAVAGLAVRVIAPATLAPLGTSPNVLALLAVGFGSSVVVSLVALVVASIVVFRAGVIGGVARWGLLVLAIATAITSAVGLSDVPAVGPVEIVSTWGYPVELVLQLALGVFYIHHGRTTALNQRREAVHEQ